MQQYSGHVVSQFWLNNSISFPVSGSIFRPSSSGSPESLEKGGLAGHCAAGGVSCRLR